MSDKLKKIRTFDGPSQHIYDGDIITIKQIKEECKKAKVKFHSNIEIRTTISWVGCYYEGDQPSIKIELWA